MSRGDVIIALDFPSAEAVYAFLDKFENEARKPYVKVGMELFYAEGPQIVREIKARGHKIFLDLKLHDIPNTVKKAMASLSRLDVDMTNLHAAGTIDMMKAALEGLTRPDGTRPMLLAVTQLTSTSEERMQRELLINASMPDTVKKYAQNAKEAGLDGVVCSPLEAGLVKEGGAAHHPGSGPRGGLSALREGIPWRVTKEERPSWKNRLRARYCPSARCFSGPRNPSPGPAASRAPFTATTA